jgi:hypothetical protein
MSNAVLDALQTNSDCNVDTVSGSRLTAPRDTDSLGPDAPIPSPRLVASRNALDRDHLNLALGDCRYGRRADDGLQLWADGSVALSPAIRLTKLWIQFDGTPQSDRHPRSRSRDEIAAERLRRFFVELAGEVCGMGDGVAPGEALKLDFGITPKSRPREARSSLVLFDPNEGVRGGSLNLSSLTLLQEDHPGWFSGISEIALNASMEWPSAHQRLAMAKAALRASDA